MALSMNRIHTKDEIREMFETWLKYRDELDYEFKLWTTFDGFNIESTRVTNGGLKNGSIK